MKLLLTTMLLFMGLATFASNNFEKEKSAKEPLKKKETATKKDVGCRTDIIKEYKCKCVASSGASDDLLRKKTTNIICNNVIISSVVEEHNAVQFCARGFYLVPNSAYTVIISTAMQPLP